LAEAREKIARLESDATAREALLAESQAEQSALGEKLSAAETERKIEAEAFAQLRNDLEASRKEVEVLKGEEAALREKLKEIEARSAALEAAEQDIEKRAALRAAQIIAETGTSAPANITPKGEAAQADDLYEQFRSIANPTEQTAFWQQLTPAQQAQILARATASTSNP
jgi:septal ring factor EnvC (AmiA/AmiB activator)